MFFGPFEPAMVCHVKNYECLLMDLPPLFPSFNQPLKAAKQNHLRLDFSWFYLSYVGINDF